MSGIDATNKLPRKFKKRRAKTKNGRQDQRLKKLEQTVFQSLERKSKTLQWGGGAWNISENGSVINNGTYPAFQLQRGNNSEELLGNKVNLLNQTIRFCLSTPDPVGDTWNKVRLIVAEPVGETQSLAISDVLTFPPSATSPMVNSAELVMCSPYTVKTTSGKRYKVHYDRVFELNETNHSILGKIKIKYGKSGKIVNFPESISGLNVPTDHNLSMFMMSDSSVTPHPKLEVNIRSNYYDA